MAARRAPAMTRRDWDLLAIDRMMRERPGAARGGDAHVTATDRESIRRAHIRGAVPRLVRLTGKTVDELLELPAADLESLRSLVYGGGR